MHAPDQRFRRHRGPTPQPIPIPPLLAAAVKGAEEFTPLPGIISDREVLLKMLEELREISGKNLNRGIQPELIGQDDAIVGEIDVSSALTNAVHITPNTNRLYFYDIPSGLSTFEVRINDVTKPSIDVFKSGRDFFWPTVIKRVFITTVPAITDGRIKYMTGGAKVDQLSPRESPPIINRVFTQRHIEHVMVAAVGFHFVIPGVPAGEIHRYSDIAFQIRGTQANHALNLRTTNGAEVTLIEMGNLSLVDSLSRLNLLASWGNTGGGSSETQDRGTVDVLPGGSWEIGTNTPLVIGNTVVLDYIFETLPGPGSFLNDARTIGENESAIPAV